MQLIADFQYGQENNTFLFLCHFITVLLCNLFITTVIKHAALFAESYVYRPQGVIIVGRYLHVLKYL